VDQTGWVAVASIVASMVLNGLYFSFRMGRLEQKVDDLRLYGSNRVHERLAVVETKLGLGP
jgi:hypothetical protein